MEHNAELELLKQISSLIFPKHLLEYFSVVKVEERPVMDPHGIETGELVFTLEETNIFRNQEDGHIYRPNGFYDASQVRDFPLRDKKVLLLIKRRRWLDVTTGNSVGNTYNLVAEGTRHSVEFAAFLKECFGSIPDISLFS